MSNTSVNPLLEDTLGPRFDAVTPAHVLPAIDSLLQRCEQALEQALQADTPTDYHAIAEILDAPLQALDDAWGLVCHLQAVANTPELRAAHAQARPKVVAFHTRMAADVRLFDRLQRIDADVPQQLSGAQRAALKHRLRDLRLSGAELQGAEKQRFAAIQQRLAELGRNFSNRLLDATDAFEHWVPPNELNGVPQEVVEALLHAGRQAGREDGLCKLTLQQPCMGPVMQYTQNRALREKLYRAHVTRASEFGPAPLDNTALIAEMLALRHERAALLGHAHHAEVSLQAKMADSAEQVGGFLRDLGSCARVQAERELDELRAFARDELGIHTLEAWDVAFAAEKLRQARHAFSDDEVRQYFELGKMLSGLFEIAEALFDVSVFEERQPVWHAGVRAYRIERAGVLLGRLLLDPSARSGKRAGAWMSGARPRWRKPSGEVRPALAYIVTNFPEPAPGKPALLTHREVVTLFHEMGHALHFLLSHVDVPGVSGISGVEWDAVELPSQLMENFAWEWAVIERISAHVLTGAPLPRSLFERMHDAKSFQCGMQLLRQVELSLFDLRVHAEPRRCNEAQVVFDEVRADQGVMAPPAYNRYQNGFSHIFAGGYAAGYYSYLWAEVLSADAWSVFEREGVLNALTGARYRQAILERGGSRPMKDSFREFVGRAPAIDALLKQRGLTV